MTLHCFATAPSGAAEAVRDELIGLGAETHIVRSAGVEFDADLALAYSACLWLRAAGRMLLVISRFEIDDDDDLYRAVRQIDWDVHLGPQSTLAVDSKLRNAAVAHSRFAALRVKDAIVDQMRERHGERPSVDVEAPGLGVHLFVAGRRAQLAIDLGGPLHRRGYRERTLGAPLREHLAAALLLRAGWPAIAARGGTLLDPMCGSGTLPIEAALMAAQRAPGLLRGALGSPAWRGHDRGLWDSLRREAEARALDAGAGPLIVGCDADRTAAAAAQHHVGRAGLTGHVRIERRALAECAAFGAEPPGLVIVNPPYGQRLGDVEQLEPLYAGLGALLREHFNGWQAAVLTAEARLARALELRLRRSHRFFNGALECRLLRFDVEPRPSARRPGAVAAPAMLNRLQKNLRRLGKWAERNGIECYRLYDADVPEYAFAVDLYRASRDGNEHRLVHAQEYAAPDSVDPAKARQRRDEALAAIRVATGVEGRHLYVKVRRRQRGRAQYGREDASEEWHTVREAHGRFLVNLRDYLDTGLFLSHRDVRALVSSEAHQRRFLNLFGYTGTATVQAAYGGAPDSTTVDLSARYLDWARRNFELNGLDLRRHRLERADCMDWLQRAARLGQRYDLILLDPPTFSNSARMDATLDLQRDHVGLIRATLHLLEPGGLLVFSCNAHRFRMDTAGLAGVALEDASHRTLAHDFARRPRAHHCWLIRHERR